MTSQRRSGLASGCETLVLALRCKGLQGLEFLQGALSFAPSHQLIQLPAPLILRQFDLRKPLLKTLKLALHPLVLPDGNNLGQLPLRQGARNPQGPLGHRIMT